MLVEQMKPHTHPTRQMSSRSFLPHEKVADQARWVWLERFYVYQGWRLARRTCKALTTCSSTPFFDTSNFREAVDEREVCGQINLVLIGNK